RAKERFFSFRDEFGQWDPKNQRPEIWSLYNGRHRKGEHIRVFPLSNWTELDIWQYIAEENIELPSIYFAHRRKVVRRDGMLMAVTDFLQPGEGEEVFEATVRYRSVGDATCTAAVASMAASIDDVITEVAASRITERGATRADDKFSEAAMEDRKREGYFYWSSGTTVSRLSNLTASARDATTNGVAPVRPRRVGRRRQEHPHRAAVVRL